MAVKISGLPELTVLDGVELIPIVSGSITKQIKYSTLKQDVLKNIPTGGGTSWSDISDKPFTSIGDGLTVIDGVLSASDTGGIDFDALAVAMTTGTQRGISITADTENKRFNFEVTGIPTIAIDGDGYWIIDGERGENPTKAQGEKGDDGISPTVIVADTGVGVTITITDKNGTTTADIFDGTDGISPHIDKTTKHWFIGENDTGISATASIDDTSVDGTEVTWSASKINSMLGDINTILASVTGGIS